MAHKTDCPACGAPVTYSGDKAVVNCDFCGAELKVIEEDGQTRFQVLSQPSPQHEVLSKPVEPAGGQGRSIIYDAGEGIPPPEGGPGMPGGADSPGVTARSGTPAADESGFSFLSGASQGVSGEDVVPGAEGTGAPGQPAATVPGGTPSYSEVGQPSAQARGGQNRWIGIALAVFLGVCLLCACAAGAYMIMQRQGMFMFEF